MDEERAVAMCVITVVTGPNGMRSAVVASRLDVVEELDERRVRCFEVTEVLEQVSAFLVAARLPGP